MKQNQRQTRTPFSLFMISVIAMAVVMLVTLALPAFAAGDDDELPARELVMTWLDWDEEGRCYAADNVLDMKNGDGADGLSYNPGRSDHIIFFIWNNETQKKEKFVVPEASGGIKVIPAEAESIAPNAKQSQYYVHLEMDGWEDTELTADGLVFHVSAMMDDHSFFSSQDFSQETYLGGEVNEETVANRTIYFGNSYAGTSEADEHSKVVTVKKQENGNEGLYTLEKVNDDCWKIVYEDVFGFQGDIWAQLKVEVSDPEGNTWDEYPGLRIYHEYPPELMFIQLQSMYNEEADREEFFFTPETLITSEIDIQPGVTQYCILGYGGQWTENGFDFEGFTPVSPKNINLKVPEGVVMDTNVTAAEDTQWARYYTALSVEEQDTDYAVTFRGHELNIHSRLPDIGVYSAPEATWENWLGPWDFPYNAALDNTYYIISTATDAVHGRHLTSMALSSNWDKEDEENATGSMELAKVSDGVYKLTRKDAATTYNWHITMEYSWTDMAGNTWTDVNDLGNFCYTPDLLSSSTAVFDATADAWPAFPAADAVGKVSRTVTIKAGEDTALHLYLTSFSWSRGYLLSASPETGKDGSRLFKSASKDLTLTPDAADPSKFTLRANKAGRYELCYGAAWGNYSTLKLYHPDGTEFSEEEWLAFDEEYMVANDTELWITDDWSHDFDNLEVYGEYVPFADVFPGCTYSWEISDEDWGANHLTVIVEPSYTDVVMGDPFYDDVVYVSVNGMMQGDGKAFNPLGTVKREMVPTVLYRMEGEPTVQDSCFTDVTATDWFAKSTSWGAENGIVLGVGDNAFGVGTNITHEQLALMLYRYAEYKGCDMTISDDLSSFTDASSIHSWALKEMRWAVGAGVISGKGGSLDPQGFATRLELASALARLSRDLL